MENEVTKEFMEKVKNEFQKAKKTIDDLTSRVSALEKEVSDLKAGLIERKKDDGFSFFKD